MRSHLKTIFAVIVMLVCCAGLFLIYSQIINIQSYPDPEAGNSGKPCTSNEEWHARADQIGFWSGGILVNETMTDAEIFSLLESYNIPNPERTRTYPAHAFGYYILFNRTDEHTFTESYPFSDPAPKIAFSSPMYEFIAPARKEVNGKIAAPVFLFFGSDQERADLFTTISNCNITLIRTRVVQIGDIELPLSKDERARRLQELNADPDVLFAFKEYLQGDIC